MWIELEEMEEVHLCDDQRDPDTPTIRVWNDNGTLRVFKEQLEEEGCWGSEEMTVSPESGEWCENCGNDTISERHKTVCPESGKK